jgi:hypothetical protein
MKYLIPGKYNPSNGMFIYYEVCNNTFWASEEKDKVEVYYGATSGGGEYYDLPLKAKKDLLNIMECYYKDTRKLTSYCRKNDLNKKE